MVEGAPGRVVVAVDGGGTKTDVAIASLDGTVLGEATGPASNWELIGLEAMTTALATTIESALGAAACARSSVVASAFCMAGFDWPSDHERIDPELARLGLSGARVLANDAMAALRAGTSAAAGVVSVAGTGGSTAGRNRHGATFRTFAISWGEASGASDLVRAAAHALARQHHGQTGPTSLTPRLLSAMGIGSVPELFERLSRRGDARLGPDIAPLVLAAAAEQDAIAMEIVRRVASRHGDDVVGVARNLRMLDDAFDVVRAGGVHLAGCTTFDDAFASVIASAAPRARIVTLDQAPVRGAIQIALELAAAVIATR